MRASLTTATFTVPLARAGATRRSQAASPGGRSSLPRSSVTDTVKGLPAKARAAFWRAKAGPSGMLDVAARERLVRLDDLLHQLVAHDVAIVEMDERDAVDRADDLHRLDEPRGAPLGQVDLRDIAGDHGFRAEAEARQEHLHLLGRRVLGLVQDDERVVQRPAAHERDGRDL